MHLVQARPFSLRYAYARSFDTRAADDPGQDYLTFRYNDQAVLFALCDGVSQSFYGDLAALYLGDALLNWLGNSLGLTLDAPTLASSLTSLLHDLTGPATEVVERHSLPESIPAMLRDVLEEKRALGSESTFICGRIDLPGTEIPQGRVVLAWMGDSRLRLWRPDGELTKELGNTFKTEQRWSSRRGPVGGDPHFFVGPLTQEGHRIDRLVAYSDGLSSLDRHGPSLPNLALQDLIDQSGQAATSDDISFLEVWLAPVPVEVEARSLPAPQLLEARLDNGHVRASWSSVPGATRYEVDGPDGTVVSEEVSIVLCESPAVEPGTYRLRVRAWTDHGPGEWSGIREVVIPQPSALKTEPVPTVHEPAPRPTPAPAHPAARRARVAIAAGGFIALVLLGSLLAVPDNGPLRVPFFGAAPTPTTTATLTPSIAPNPSPTETGTATSTPTATTIATATAGVGQVLTATSVATHGTPTAASGPALTQTVVSGPLAGATPPAPPVPTKGPTPMATTPAGPPTASPSPSATAAATPASMGSSTPTPGRAATPAATGSVTPSPTITPTLTAAAGSTPTAAATSSLTGTAAPKVSLTP